MSQLEQIRKRLGNIALDWAPSYWLDTKLPNLNRVIGHAVFGMPYGKILEISGWESAAKTSITLALAALAQIDGAHVTWGDLENSFDPAWALRRGMAKCPHCNGTGEIQAKALAQGKGVMDPCKACGGPGSTVCGLDSSKLTLIQPYVGKFGKEREERLSTAQELLAEVEASLTDKAHKKNFVALDSIAAIETAAQSEAGLENSNMSSDMSLPKFLGRLMRRWIGRAQIYNAVVVMINQLRQGPNSVGAYTTGGNAIRFYAHVRVRASRVQGSKIVSKGRTIGMKGILSCKKNKCGGEEGAEIGYRLMFQGKLEFVDVKQVRKEE